MQLVTWSDFSESSQIEPYTDATLRRDIGTGYYDLNAYYAAWFLLGKQPPITHDVLYYFYRREPTDAASPSQSAPTRIRTGSPEDDIELLAFLTAPGVVKIAIGGQSLHAKCPRRHDFLQGAYGAGIPGVFPVAQWLGRGFVSRRRSRSSARRASRPACSI